jgi:PAS domain S-box-containing protein
LTGWSLKEAEGRPLTEVFQIVNETTREIVESPAAKVKRLGSTVGLANHTILKTRNGIETHIDDSGAPIRNEKGDLTGIVLVFRNINERRQAERERNAITERLNQVLSATTDAIVSVDRDWVMTYTNPKAHEIYASTEEVVGRVVWDRFPGAVFEGSPYVEHYNRAMNEGVSGHFEAFYPEPLNVWLEIMVHPTPNGIVTFSRDITEKKRTEQALVQNEKLAAVGRLAASIAHEINNPLATVTNLLFLSRISDSLEDVKGFLETAETELQRVAVITNSTLRFYKQSSEPQLVLGDDLFASTVAIQKGKIAGSHVKVERSNRTARSVLCYDGEIRQVLNNLIGNATDAMAEHGGRLLLRTREGTDWSSGRKGLVMTVADTGMGISPENLPKILDPFFTTKGIHGNGLGLWVSSQIVANHQGVLRVRSSQKEGKSGTVFSIFLPFQSEDARALG